ncbi:MAG: winged helix-turn-helix domain-containing protein [Pseudomonadota bacterium]
MTIQRDPGAVAADGVPHAGWRIGRLEVDLRREQVRLDGVPVPLERSAHALLRRLFERAGHVVAKDELLQAGWPGRIVAENSLAKAISKLRHAIGDDAGTLIRVVHGYGYRLVGEVEAIAATESQRPFGRASAWKWGFAGVLAGSIVFAAWGWAVQSPATTSILTRPAAPGEDVIAVLPFDDISRDRSLRMLGDGYATHLREYLHGVPALRIVNRAETLAYRGGTRDLPAAARALGANLVVGGELDWRQGRLHASVRLHDASGKVRPLAKAFERPPGDQALLLEDLTAAVAMTLGDRPQGWRTDPRSGRGTSNPEAYRAYLHSATRFAGGRDPNSQRRTIVALRRALMLDPNYGDAWIALGEIYGDSTAPWADTLEEIRAGRLQALAAMNRGIALGADTPFNLATRSEIRLLYHHDWRGAWADIAAAAARTPGGESATLLIWQARFAASLGRLDEAIALGERAIALDQQAGARRNQGWHYLGKGDTRRARSVLLLELRELPENPHVNFYLALCDILDGRPQAALPRLEHSSTLFRLVGTAIARYDMGDSAGSEVALQKLVETHAMTQSYWIAGVHSWRGELDQAYDWLDRAIDRRDSSVPYLVFDPLMRNLRRDSRYPERRARLGMPADPGFTARAVTSLARAPGQGASR